VTAPELRARPRGRAFRLTPLAGAHAWSLAIWGALPSRWCGNLTLNCTGFGIDILHCEAERFGRGRWSALFVLDASRARSDPRAMDFLHMSLRRPALFRAAAGMRIEGFRLAPPDEADGDLGGDLGVDVWAPDRLGLLAVLLDRFESLGLVPAAIRATSEDGVARDHFRLTGQAGPPPRTAREQLARCLGALRG